MMRDDVRKLIGGYATGSLTEAERKLLFEAALEDQELFDELAREDALRELLDEPGAKQRLIASLETSRSKPARIAWWAVAATGLAAVLFAVVMFRPPNKPAQVADALRPIAQSSAPVKEPAEPPRQPVTAVPAPRAKVALERRQDARLEAKAEEAKDEKKAEVGQAEPASPPQLKQLMASRARETDQAAANGRVTGTAAPAALSLRAPLSKAARFAFDYALEPNRQLKITPAADGYLSVEIAGLRAEPVKAGISLSVRIPDRTDTVSVSFSASPNPPPAPASLRDQPSGTVEDPNPSSNSHLAVTIRITAPAR